MEHASWSIWLNSKIQIFKLEDCKTYPKAFKHATLQSLYNATHYNTVLFITRPGLGSQMVIFVQFINKIIPL